MEVNSKIEKLKKLFPLAFKHCKDIKSLILCAFLHSLIPFAFVAAYTIIITIVTTVAGIIYLVALCISYLLCFVLIGIPMMFIVIFVYSAFMFIVVLACWVALCFMPTVVLYSLAGTTISVLAHIGVFGEITFPEKEEKNAAEDVPAIEE